MPRKKNAKGSAKRQSSNPYIAFIKLEQEFFGAPTRLTKHVNKEIKALKQNEKKIKSELNKNQSAVKAAEKRMKPNATKKQMKTAEKLRANLLRSSEDLNKQLNQNCKHLECFMDSHAKLNALNDHLNAFEKDWSKAPKKTNTTATSKTRKKTTAKSESTADQEISRAEPFSTHEEAMTEETEEAMS